MPKSLVLLLILGCPLQLELNAQTPALNERERFAGSGSSLHDSFGFCVAASDEIAVVGGPSDNHGLGSSAGSAYVFRSNGTSWIEEQFLVGSSTSSNSFFGRAVSVSGDVLVVGAPGHDSPAGISSGAAYVFRFNGVDWIEEQLLLASDAASGDSFGWAVSVSGDVIVVGAHRNGATNGMFAGSTYVFRYIGTSWVEDQHLLASDGAPGDQFGASVSVSEDLLVVGAPSTVTVAGPLIGSAYVFRFNGAEWIEEQRLCASNGSSPALFGLSVAAVGDLAAIGAPSAESGGAVAVGSAYVFRFDGTNWFEEQHLFASDGAELDSFGTSVAIGGGLAVVGAQGDNSQGLSGGAGYLFQYDGQSWQEVRKLVASPAIPSSRLGASVVLTGDLAILGDPAVNTSIGTIPSGGAYVFKIQASSYVRGDANVDGVRDLADAVMILAYLFQNEQVSCRRALDANDDMDIDLADGVYMLSTLLAAGPPLGPPLACGPDPTPDELQCLEFPVCPD